MYTKLQTKDLPPHFLRTVLIELAKVFCAHMGKVRNTDLEAAGFDDLADLLLRGWIRREAGRFSIGYLPGAEVQAEMWEIRPELCELLGFARKIKPSKERQAA